MSFDYSYVLPPTGQAENAQVREMFEDVKAYVNTLISGGGSGAPDNAQYVTLTANANLSAERVLTAGTGISLTDNGAGSTVVIANTGVTSITVSDPYGNLSRSPSTGAVTLSMVATPTYTSIILQSASGSIGITPSASAFTSYNLTLPLNTGTSGYVLTTNGATPTAVLAWTDLSSIGVTSVHGTADQINVTATTGSVTFSTPQDIATTSNPTFSTINLGAGTSSDPAISIGDINSGFYEDSGGDGFISLVLDGTIGTQWNPSTLTLWNTGPLQAPSLKLRNGSGQIVTISPNGSFTSYSLVMPVDDGTANQYLTTDGSGTLSWTNAAGTGTVNTGSANRLAYYLTATNAVQALGAITNGRALISDTDGLPTHSVTSSGELAFVSGVTSAIQTQLDGKALKALSNLASVAINTTLVSDTDNTDDLGTSSINWKDLYIRNIKSGSTTAIVFSSGLVGFGGVAAANDPVEVHSATSSAFRGQLSLYDSTAVGAGVGGQLAFGGKYTGSTYTEFASIQGTKKNATDANLDAQLILRARSATNGMQTHISVDGNTQSITQPLQPSFLVTNSTGATDITGDGTDYTVLWNNEIYDQSGNFASNTFTAPITGRYLLSSTVTGENYTTLHTVRYSYIATSNRNYIFEHDGGVLSADQSFTITVIADMDAGDTAVVHLVASGSTKTVDIVASASLVFFSGSLIN